MEFADTLALWYAQHGRELPWRIADGSMAADERAYRVWLSEVMLQQTTVRQGTDYYLRFLHRWPTVEALASATEDEVLREWQGLGYYSRARNLHAAARQIAALGHFPSTYKDIRTLPGVGPYTAAAIASIAFGLPHAVVDGNVYRVLARYFGIEEPIDIPAGQRLFADLAQELLDLRHPARHNQAIMDFGATQCTPHSPHCEICPLAGACVALAQSRVEELPKKARRTAVKEVHINYTLAHTPSGLYLRQRPAKGIWAKMWELLPSEEIDNVLSLKGNTQCTKTPIGTFRHQLTHRTIVCHATALRLPPGMAGKPPFEGDIEGHFVSWDEIDRYALPKLIENIITTWRKP